MKTHHNDSGRGDQGDPVRWTTAADGLGPEARWLRAALRDAAQISSEQAWSGAVERDLRRPPWRGSARRWALVAGALLLGSTATTVAARSVLRRFLHPAVSTHVATALRPVDPTKPRARAARPHAPPPVPGDMTIPVSQDALVEPAAAPPARPAASVPNTSSPRLPVRRVVRPALAMGTPAGAAPRALPPLSEPSWGPRPDAAPPSTRADTGLPAESARVPPPFVAEQRAGTNGPVQGATATEGRMLSEALWDLRVAANPRAALSRLDLYGRLYPGGRLAEEAMMVRAEALFRSGDETKTLEILDQVALGDRSGRNALRLVRGELRAIRGRCVEALDDFRAVAAVETRDEAAERALYGHAACRARLGNSDQARRELGDYLRRFPHGKHRADAERYLQEFVAQTPAP